MICRDVLNDRRRDARLIAVMYERRDVLCAYLYRLSRRGGGGGEDLGEPILKFRETHQRDAEYCIRALSTTN